MPILKFIVLGVKGVKLCLNCGNETNNPKFCSRTCSVTFNNKLKAEKRFCLFCGASLPTKTYTDNVYCNHTCAHNHRYALYIERWKNGLEDGLRGGYQTSKYIHRYIIEKFGNKCTKCGWCEVNPYTNKVPLELEHKDGNYLNNKEENLDLLCPNCHSLTATYKGANKGNGRQNSNFKQADIP